MFTDKTFVLIFWHLISRYKSGIPVQFFGSFLPLSAINASSINKNKNNFEIFSQKNCEKYLLTMKIAIEGCLHGELQKVYETIEEIEKREHYKVDLLLCCGDFQATRNLSDLKCMAVPDKYKEMGSFYKYFSGELKAPILTLVIGGNHEASNHLQVIDVT